MIADSDPGPWAFVACMKYAVRQVMKGKIGMVRYLKPHNLEKISEVCGGGLQKSVNKIELSCLFAVSTL